LKAQGKAQELVVIKDAEIRSAGGITIPSIFAPDAPTAKRVFEFFTANMPEPDPEKLSRILTGVLPSAATLFEIVPLKVIRPVEASLVTELREPAS